MSGNVYEWNQDWHGEYNLDAKNQIDPMGAASGCDRVTRGGSWFNDGWSARSANRESFPIRYRSDFVGFRVVRTK